MKFIHSRPFLITELALLTIGMPLVLWLVLPPRYILPVVWIMAILCFFIARASVPAGERDGWAWGAVNWRNLRPILARFAVSALLLVGATYILMPDALFQFVRERPRMWLMVMCLYPILSVVPQETIFRTYLYARFRTLLHPPLVMLLVSGLGFGFAHIVFDNWVAPTLCAIGGLYFAHTYQKTRSLALVSLEHALYGDFLFTVGLGRYFYHGAVGAGG